MTIDQRSRDDPRGMIGVAGMMQGTAIGRSYTDTQRDWKYRYFYYLSPWHRQQWISAVHYTK